MFIKIDKNKSREKELLKWQLLFQNFIFFVLSISCISVKGYKGSSKPQIDTQREECLLSKNTNTGMAAEMTNLRWYSCHSEQKIQSVHQPDNEVLGPEAFLENIQSFHELLRCCQYVDPVPLCLVSISQLLGADCVSEPTQGIYKL